MLLKGDCDDLSTSSYSRADVCEVEPTAVACVLRILLRYVVEIEAVDTRSLTPVQLNCYVQTLDVIIHVFE